MLDAAILGWRAWYIERHDGQVVLRSMNAGAGDERHRRRLGTWPTHRRMIAVCEHTSHTPPGVKCRCGVYAVTTLAHLRDDTGYGGTIDYIVGQVALWGGVIVGEHGYRAQFAFPHKLYVPNQRWQEARELREAYGCETQLWDPYGWRL
jgi:hypothetical protein